jgi:hypothetical protein
MPRRETGKPYWVHDMLAAIWGSPFVADGKVYLGDEDGDVPMARCHLNRNELYVRQQGADGVKLLSPPRDVLEAAATGGLPVAIHIGVTDASALDVTAAGSSIEHWYGIPDAALPAGVQNFPPSYNYDNETDRFRWAGRLWREADAERLGKVLQTMVERNVVWDPTLNIYEAARDLQRAQSQPWFRDYLHPALEQFFRPSPTNHGSFFFGWTTGDEVAWKENYRLWMNALVDFERRGGVIGTGEDAGFIYQIQGFGFIRELELHQEAGFHPLKVIQHATHNGARILNRDHELRPRSRRLAGRRDRGERQPAREPETPLPRRRHRI